MHTKPSQITPTIAICDERLRARLVLPEGIDRDAASELSLRAIARERGIEVTHDVQRHLAGCSARYLADGKPFEKEIAFATLPNHGTDAWLEWMDGFDPALLENGPETDEKGGVNYYENRTFISVGVGDHVATLHPATEGTDGRDVCGGVIAAVPGKRLGMAIEKSLQLNDDHTLVAQIDGVLKLSHGKLRIDPVLEIAGTVDFSTGHIDFDGDVVIREDIRDHFRVWSSRDVVIGGLIDASHIKCRRNLQARRGVAGRDEGTLDIGGDAEISYLERVRGRIGGTLLVTREIMHSDLKVGGDVISDLGRVIGGTLHVMGDVRVAELGSRGDTPTVIRLGPQQGQDDGSGEASERIDELQAEIRALRATTEPRSAAVRDRITELQFELDGLVQSSDELGAGVIREPQAYFASLEVLKKIHARVTIEVAGRTVTFAHEVRGPIKIWLEGSTIMQRLGTADPKPMREIAGVSDRLAA